jgi:hypothetical protein
MAEHRLLSPAVPVPMTWLARLVAVVSLSGVLVSGFVVTTSRPAAAASGPDLCAQVAAQAGFSGRPLVRAVAIAMAESGCNPGAFLADGPTAGCPNGSTDRGLWQINNCYHAEVSDACAYDPQCAANAAYAISSGGADFNPWVTYRTGSFRAYMREARSAVRRLGR